MSGSTPVVSQSIMNPMVPVGASTVACALRKPNSSPSSTASSQRRDRRGEQIVGHDGRVDVASARSPVLAHDAQERLAVRLVAGERPAVVARDAGRLVA